jgi:hypothetical protein
MVCQQLLWFKKAHSRGQPVKFQANPPCYTGGCDSGFAVCNATGPAYCINSGVGLPAMLPNKGHLGFTMRGMDFANVIDVLKINIRKFMTRGDKANHIEKQNGQSGRVKNNLQTAAKKISVGVKNYGLARSRKESRALRAKLIDEVVACVKVLNTLFQHKSRA